MKEKKNQLLMSELFAGIQEQLGTDLGVGRRLSRHPTAAGDDSEGLWLRLLQRHLPKRYRAERAFVLDSNGNVSDQIDIVVFDAQYSPYWAVREGYSYIPAESVYAVFEAKQEMSAETLRYASEKVASVRSLHRTSVPIHHAGGRYRAKRPFAILGGLLATAPSWTDLSPARLGRLPSAPLKRLDLGCCAKGGSFEVRGKNLQVVDSGVGLSFFMLRLLARLQALGTAPALSYDAYSESVVRQLRGKGHGDGR